MKKAQRPRPAKKVQQPPKQADTSTPYGPRYYSTVTNAICAYCGEQAVFESINGCWPFCSYCGGV